MRKSRIITCLTTPRFCALSKKLRRQLKRSREVSVCGDMAQTAQYIPFLIGIGITALSMNPIYFAENQKLISNIDSIKAKAAADEMLASSSIEHIEKILARV